MRDRISLIKDTLKEHFCSQQGICSCGERIYEVDSIYKVILKTPTELMIEHLSVAIHCALLEEETQLGNL